MAWARAVIVCLGAGPTVLAGAAQPAPPASGKGPVEAATATEMDDSRAARTLPPAIERAVGEKEKEVVAARHEGILLLEAFLHDSPRSRETAEALYKLAELYWEESKATYLVKMGDYQRLVTACHHDRSECRAVPKRQPRLDLAQAQGDYDRLIREYPHFRKIDTVLYLYAFSLRDQGRTADSVQYFQTLLDEHPRSRFIADAWMAIAEYRFYDAQNFRSALAAYEQVLQSPQSSLYDLALFKTAWCYWKIGDTTRSAQRFKDVLDLARKKADKTGTEQKRAADLQGQAMEYLVELFTEDDTKSARDAFEFLAQIGGSDYSQKILSRLAETVFDQTRYERAAEAYRLLISLNPNGPDAPDQQKRIVECAQALGDPAAAVLEMRKLASEYGPHSPWAAANRERPNAVAHARQIAEEQIRGLAKSLHAEAQAGEKQNKVVDKERYARAAEAYEFYLATFPDAGDGTELRYLRADILYFKLGRLADAGDEYLRVGQTRPPGRFHKDALLQAMNAFEKLRKPAGGARREITESDRKFAAAADIYATLFPKDQEIVTVIYKNGQFFFDYGDYDEAVKRFGLIVERYPDDANAGPAGDRILESLSKAKDYENIEQWARRLKNTKPFAAKAEQERLDRMIVVAIMKSGEKYAAQGKLVEAAEFFRRVPRDFPKDARAPQALHNAAAMLERAKHPEDAVAAYTELADKYPQAAEAPESLFTAAHIEETIAVVAQRRNPAADAGGEREGGAPFHRVRAQAQGASGCPGAGLRGRRGARATGGLEGRGADLRGVRARAPGRPSSRRGLDPRRRRRSQGRQRRQGQGCPDPGAGRRGRQGPQAGRCSVPVLGGRSAVPAGGARLSGLRAHQDRRQAQAAGAHPRGEG